jgi:hypothetical protein
MDPLKKLEKLETLLNMKRPYPHDRMRVAIDDKLTQLVPVPLLYIDGRLTEFHNERRYTNINTQIKKYRRI